MPLFSDRYESGRQLACQLLHYRDRPDIVILALPRGGVPVAAEVARRLHAALDVFIVRKLGLPGYEELAMGAIAAGGVLVLNAEVLEALGVSEADVEPVIEQELQEIKRREQVYRAGHPPAALTGRTVILVDDGLATGASMRAAVQAAQRQEPERIVVAVPVASQPACDEIVEMVDELVCLAIPEPFYSVGTWYLDFSQVGDDEVQALLQEATSSWGGVSHA